MSSTPAVLVLDLDGTLLGPDHALHPANVEVLADAHARGVHVVIATGRILAATLPVLAPLPFVPWCICCGGQTVIAPGEAPAVTAFLHPEVVADVLRRAAAVDDVAVQLYRVTDQDMWRPNAAGLHLAASESIAFRHLDDLPRIAPDDLLKIVLTAEADVARRVDAAFADARGYACTPTGARYRDVLPHGVDKGAALDRLLGRTGWPADRVLAAGDAPNDLPVFARARWRVAVDHGCAPLLAEATSVVPTNAGDALARALRAALA